MRAAQERRGGPHVIPRALAPERHGRSAGEAGYHCQLVAKRRNRLQDRGDVERPFVKRRPVGHVDPVRDIHHREAGRGPSRGFAERREGGNHAVEQRQGERRAHAAQHCPS